MQQAQRFAAYYLAAIRLLSLDTPTSNNILVSRDTKGRFQEGNPGKPFGARHKKSMAAEIKEQLEELTSESVSLLADRITQIRNNEGLPVDLKDLASSVASLIGYILPKKTEVTEFTHDHIAQTFEMFSEFLTEKGVDEADLQRLQGYMYQFLEDYVGANN